MDDKSRVGVVGPLAPYAPGFWGQLRAQGYVEVSAQAQVRLLAHLSRWMQDEGLAVAGLTAGRVEGFLRTHHASGHGFPKSAKGLVPTLQYLRSVGVIPPAPAPSRSATEELVDRFGEYLAGERGLAVGTIANYAYAATLLLAACAGRDLDQLSATEIQGFLLVECGKRSVASAKCLVSGIRSFLRFLHVEGITPGPLSGAVPTISGWTGGFLPRGIDAASVKALLASCDRASVKGCRDFAILVLLTRLGIRAGEVAALELGDIDWRGGELLIRGKAARVERLPCPSASATPWRTMSEMPVHAASVASCSCASSPRIGGSRWAGSALLSTPPVTGRGCRRSGRTGCGTLWRRNCCTRVPGWPRSANCFGIAA